MYACVCAQITDEQWKKALLEAGHDWHRASMATGAGLGCGGCRVYLGETAHALKEQQDTPLDLPIVDPCPVIPRPA